MHVVRHGTAGPPVVVLHGGPGAPGSAAGLARGLGERGFRVLEPWQREAGEESLTVARHVADLAEVVTSLPAEDTRPALVGHSWGAMLALAYAAAHPDDAGPLALVGCGTFDETARAKLRETRRERAGDGADRDPRGQDDFDALPHDPCRFDERGHHETWNDMLRRQADGTYPAAFAAITSPVVMIHGIHDSHPGPMVRDGLRPHLARLEYVELQRCGHEPWRERQARDRFFEVLADWLRKHTNA